MFDLIITYCCLAIIYWFINMHYYLNFDHNQMQKLLQQKKFYLESEIHSLN
jgi:hypothetical protein